MFLRLAFVAPRPVPSLAAQAETPHIILFEEITLSQVYHDGLSSPGRNGQSYLFAVMPSHAALATNQKHVRDVLGRAAYEMKYWKTGNRCAGADRVPGQDVVIFQDAKVAEARIRTGGFFSDDFTFELTGKAVPDDAYGKNWRRR